MADKFAKRNKSDAPRYKGSLCLKHPEFMGERYTCNYNCVGCARDNVKRANKKPESQARIRAWWKKAAAEGKTKIYKTKSRSSDRAKDLARAAHQRAHAKIKDDPDYKAYRARYNDEYRKSPRGTAVRRHHQRVREQTVSKHALPRWADLDAIALVYSEARAVTLITGVQHSVDHIVPLKGKNVCGLHVENNLDVLPIRVNSRKNNSLLFGG